MTKSKHVKKIKAVQAVPTTTLRQKVGTALVDSLILAESHKKSLAALALGVCAWKCYWKNKCQEWWYCDSSSSSSTCDSSFESVCESTSTDCELLDCSSDSTCEETSSSSCSSSSSSTSSSSSSSSKDNENIILIIDDTNDSQKEFQGQTQDQAQTQKQKANSIVLSSVSQLEKYLSKDTIQKLGKSI